MGNFIAVVAISVLLVLAGGIGAVIYFSWTGSTLKWKR